LAPPPFEPFWWVCAAASLARLRDGGLEGRLGNRFGPLFAALDRQLAGRLDRRLVGRDATAEVVEHGQPRPLLHVAEDGLQFGAVQRFLLQKLAGQLVEHVAVLGEDLPRLGVRRLDELADLVVDDPAPLHASSRPACPWCGPRNGSPCSLP
jgi:hypothetical protein